MHRIATRVGLLIAVAACGGSSADDDDDDVCARLSMNTASGTVAIAGCSGDISVADARFNNLGQLAGYSFSISCGSEQHSGEVTRIDWVNNAVTCFDATVDGQVCASCAPPPDAAPPDDAAVHDECFAIDAPPDFPTALAWSPDGTLLAGSISDNGTRLFQLPAGTALPELDSLSHDVVLARRRVFA
jgi:hypothetical protein